MKTSDDYLVKTLDFGPFHIYWWNDSESSGFGMSFTVERIKKERG